ncbi:MAG: ferritin family protein [Spirochaetia bacterium]|jgi:rubrerythrin|nr:ferritin family protein [Spirochaetia bacterium]
MTSSSNSYVTIAELKTRLIDFEEESARTYATLMELTADENANSILGLLMREEKEHAKKLGNLRVEDRSAGLLQFPPEVSLSMPPIPVNKDLGTMLAYAVEREAQSARIYTSAASQSSGAFKELFVDLAAWEHRHEERVSQLKNELTGGR